MFTESIIQKDSYWARLLSDSKSADSILQVVCLRQGWGELQFDRTICTGNGPLTLNGKEYKHGLGTHTDSDILIKSPKDMCRIKLVAGVNDSALTRSNKMDAMIFRITACGRILAQSHDMYVADEPFSIDIDLPAGCREITLTALSATGNIAMGHANWCDIEIYDRNGKIMPLGCAYETMTFVPFSFEYNGASSYEFLSQWNRQVTDEDMGDFVRKTIIFSNPEDKFECSFVLDSWKDYPVSYYRVGFANRGDTNSGVLSNVKVLDDNFNATTFTSARGAFDIREKIGPTAKAFADNFRLHTFDKEGETVRITAGTGRSSAEWMPFARFSNKEGGVIIALGWTGQWIMDCCRFDRDWFSVKGGMEDLETILFPGEEITQPSVMRLDYCGEDPITGHNILRRFLYNEWLPQKMRQLPVCFSAWGGKPASAHLEMLKSIKETNADFDCYWIDAGWYGDGQQANEGDYSEYWVKNVGSWFVNPWLYPDGMGVVGDAVHALGKKFLLWFEPERAYEGSKILQEHPEYFIPAPFAHWINLARQDAREWMLNMLTDMMKAGNVDYYRQDANSDTISYWRSADVPGRKGMTEVRSVEGLYWVLDELRKRFPGMLIDNCASGGRRLDIEMMRRSVPLWPSDLQCMSDWESEQMQEVVAGLNYWSPVSCWGPGLKYSDTYNFRSVFGTSTVIAFPAKKEDQEWAKTMVAQLRRASVYTTGDYYPIMGQSYDPAKWMVQQYHRPELGGGCLIALRRKNSGFSKGEFKLSALDTAKNYSIEDADTGTIITLSGMELTNNGLPIELAAPATSKLYFYKEI